MISLLLAEDMEILRGALVALLNLEHDMRVVVEVTGGDEILPAVRAHRPDIAIIDIDLPGMDGLAAAAEVHAARLNCRTLVLTSLNHPGAVRRALDAHVNGFLLKDVPPERLTNAIRQIAAGRRVIDSELALAAWEQPDCPLTGREIEILRLAAGGQSVGGVADQLFLSAGTVRNYLSAIVTKLNARNRVDAIRIARESGWL